MVALATLLSVGAHVAAQPPGPDPGPENVLLNPSFENQSDTGPAEWKPST